MDNEKMTVAIESTETPTQTDPSCYAIQIKSGESVVTASLISRKISRHCHFCLKEEKGEINGNVFSTNYRPPTIP